MKKAEERIVEKLIENDVKLQKKVTELTLSIGKLTHKVGDLVDIFEGAAKKIKPDMEEPGLTSLLGKLESLLEQNKAIASGLVLLEKYVRGREIGSGRHLKPSSPL